MKNEKTYKLPAPIAMALATNRAELIDAAISAISSPSADAYASAWGVDPVEMLRLIRDLIADRQQLAAERDDAINALRDLNKMIAGSGNVLDKVITTLESQQNR